MSNSPFHAFDDAVLRAMDRWPDVPQCFGWLGLDRRGCWRIRGALISHRRALDFLSRHYRADDAGRWFVQNGPQQVFVDLDYTPWIYRHAGAACFDTHTGITAGPAHGAWLDEDGNLLVETAAGVGLVDDRDLAGLAALIDDAQTRLQIDTGAITIEAIEATAVARRFGFVPHPREA